MNTFNQRAQQKEETARAVLEAARTEFEKVGFERANVRSIAKRAGVSAGTVLHHYGDKRELLHAALFDDLQAALTAALKVEGTLEARLQSLGRKVFKHYAARPKLARTQLKESLFADPPWAKRFTDQTGLVHVTIAAWAAEAVKAKQVRKTLDPTLFAAAWLSFFYFALIGWVQGALEKPAVFVDHLTAQHLGAHR